MLIRLFPVVKEIGEEPVGVRDPAAGAVLVVLPHLVGAPKIVPESGPLPAELAAEFAVVALLTSAMFWLALGATAGHLLGRSEPSAQAETA